LRRSLRGRGPFGHPTPNAIDLLCYRAAEEEPDGLLLPPATRAVSSVQSGPGSVRSRSRVSPAFSAASAAAGLHVTYLLMLLLAQKQLLDGVCFHPDDDVASLLDARRRGSRRTSGRHPPPPARPAAHFDVRGRRLGAPRLHRCAAPALPSEHRTMPPSHRVSIRLSLTQLTRRPRKPAPSDLSQTPHSEKFLIFLSPLLHSFPCAHYLYIQKTGNAGTRKARRCPIDRDRPANIPWSVGEHKGVCTMLVCKCEPCDHASQKSRK
jgi:hypothetical protein